MVCKVAHNLDMFTKVPAYASVGSVLIPVVLGKALLYKQDYVHVALFKKASCAVQS